MVYDACQWTVRQALIVQAGKKHLLLKNRQKNQKKRCFHSAPGRRTVQHFHYSWKTCQLAMCRLYGPSQSCIICLYFWIYSVLLRISQERSEPWKVFDGMCSKKEQIIKSCENTSDTYHKKIRFPTPTFFSSSPQNQDVP